MMALKQLGTYVATDSASVLTFKTVYIFLTVFTTYYIYMVALKWFKKCKQF